MVEMVLRWRAKRLRTFDGVHRSPLSHARSLGLAVKDLVRRLQLAKVICSPLAPVLGVTVCDNAMQLVGRLFRM